jgi:hypothetical protein
MTRPGQPQGIPTHIVNYAFALREADRPFGPFGMRSVNQQAAPIRALFANAERITRETGVVHSVEHMVPLAGGTVCGLHWHGNMEVRPLRDNLVKGTRWWPDMWETQQELFE